MGFPEDIDERGVDRAEVLGRAVVEGEIEDIAGCVDFGDELGDLGFSLARTAEPQV